MALAGVEEAEDRDPVVVPTGGDPGERADEVGDDVDRCAGGSEPGPLVARAHDRAPALFERHVVEAAAPPVNAIVDTSVWSLALRRARRLDGVVQHELAELVREGRAVMMGPVRQELLSGIKERTQFEMLRDQLRAFPDLVLETEDHEQAASAFNRCRERGVQGSNTDFLMCAAAMRRGLSVFTTDGDFRHFARVLELELHEPRRR